MTAKLFEAALGIAEPWLVASVDFDEKAKTLTVLIDFKPGTRFGISGHEGAHPVHDTVTKTYRHLNFFQHECHLQVRTPRVKLPNCSVRLVELDFAGRLNGFTLLFEALILMLARGPDHRCEPPAGRDHQADIAKISTYKLLGPVG